MYRLLGASALALAIMSPAAQAIGYDHQASYQAAPPQRYQQQVRHYRGHHRYAVRRLHHRYAVRRTHHRYAVRDESGSRTHAIHQVRVSGGRPRAWCGWYARSLVGRDPGVAYNLARNWARWGRPSGPAVGVMVVWSHHVGMITGRTSDGQWIVKSGNDGHGVRERPRSLAGAIAFRAG
jgi:hypothetical protein